MTRTPRPRKINGEEHLDEHERVQVCLETPRKPDILSASLKNSFKTGVGEEEERKGMEGSVRNS